MIGINPGIPAFGAGVCAKEVVGAGVGVAPDTADIAGADVGAGVGAVVGTVVGASTVIGTGGDTVVATDTGTVVAIGRGVVVATGIGVVVATGTYDVVATGACTVVVTGAATGVATGAAPGVPAITVQFVAGLAALGNGAIGKGVPAMAAAKGLKLIAFIGAGIPGMPGIPPIAAPRMTLQAAEKRLGTTCCC